MDQITSQFCAVFSVLVPQTHRFVLRLEAEMICSSYKLNTGGHPTPFLRAFAQEEQLGTSPGGASCALACSEPPSLCSNISCNVSTCIHNTTK